MISRAPAAATLALLIVCAACAGNTGRSVQSPDASGGDSWQPRPALRALSDTARSQCRPGVAPLPARAAEDIYGAGCDLDGMPAGSLIDSEAVTNAPPGVNAQRIRYVSRAEPSTPTVVSALVVAPAASVPDGGFPLVGFAHGTTGIGRDCAPSISPDVDEGSPDTPAYFTAFEGFIENGYAVVATDYRGLGTPGPHGYLAGNGAGANVLDAVRATIDMSEPAVRDDSIAVYGHSQGGHATAWAAQIASRYAPELDVVAAVMLAPAADLAALIRHWLAPPTSDVLANALMVISSWSRYYDTADADTLLGDRGKAAVAAVADACVTTALEEFRDVPVESVLARDPVDVPAWKTLLRANTPGAEGTDVALFVGQGTTDTVVPPELTSALVGRLCDAGDTLEYREYPGVDHASLPAASANDVLDFLDARFAGSAPRDDCPSR